MRFYGPLSRIATPPKAPIAQPTITKRQAAAARRQLVIDRLVIQPCCHDCGCEMVAGTCGWRASFSFPNSPRWATRDGEQTLVCHTCETVAFHEARGESGDDARRKAARRMKFINEHTVK